MNTHLQIACAPDDWDASIITACGLTRGGRALLPQARRAADMPEPWLSVWRSLVEMIRGLDPGGWAATLIIAERTERREVTEDGAEGAALAGELLPSICMTIYRQWDDGTTAAPVTLDIEQPEALSLYDFLTDTTNA